MATCVFWDVLMSEAGLRFPMCGVCRLPSLSRAFQITDVRKYPRYSSFRSSGSKNEFIICTKMVCQFAIHTKFVSSIIAFYFLPCITSACLFFFLDSSCWRHIMCQNFLRGSTAPLRTWRRWTVWSKGTALPAALLRRRKFLALS